MVSLLLVRQELSVSGSEPSKQTFRVKYGPLAPVPAVNLNENTVFLLVNFLFQNSSTPTGERGAGPGPSFIEPETEAYSPSVLAAYQAGEPSVQTWNGTDWEDIPEGDAPVSDIPAMPGIFLFDPWELQGFNVPDNGLFSPFMRLIVGSGPAPDVDLPDAGTFVTTTVVDAEVVGQDFISSPQPAPFGGDVPLWATFDPTLAQEAVFSLDMTGLTVVYNGETYVAIGTRVNNISPSFTGNLDVLMENQSPLPPPVLLPISEFSVLTGNFLQVIDLIGPAPMPDDSALTSGPDDRRESAIGKLAEWD